MVSYQREFSISKMQEVDLNDGKIDLESSFDAVNGILDLFYNNKFNEAYSMADKYSSVSMLHAQAKAFVSFVYAILTLEKDELAKGMQDIEAAMQFTNKRRKCKSIVENVTGLFWKSDSSNYTDEELHAELMFGECNVLMGLLTFFSEQSFMALVKGALRMNTANHCFKFCKEALDQRKVWGSEEMKMQFESGVLNGFGAFNLVLSMVPKKILRLLSVAGFYGDKEVALNCIRKSTELTSGVRCRASVIMIQGYAMYLEQIMGINEVDPEWMGSMLKYWSNKFPKGVFVLFFLAKYHLMKGDPKKAIKEYNDCIEIQDEWTFIHRICRWDLIWSHMTLFEWNNAINDARYLAESSEYSPATNNFQIAVFKMMQMEESKNEELRLQVDDLMRSVPNLRHRIGGKTVPQEKFLCTRALQYFDDNRNDAFVLLMELYYSWNYLCLLKTNELADPFLKKIDDKIKLFEREKNKYEQSAFLTLMKGVILRNLDNDLQAVKCFEEVLNSKKKITKDTFIVPYSVLELGVTFLKMCRFEEAKRYLDKVKNDDFDKYLNESIVNLRVASALRQLHKMQNKI